MYGHKSQYPKYVRTK